ncbi:GNAT family N-acetyltransferase [Niabella hibiscisoli]|uniref:GNAT family N-acetyltransferase n=1 Tax=Niabella hibiscisoli TaxID=1825928 RepID=UPI001F118D5B|nr:GNAT family N-acetyltransferase [Niabella hibiscisoli]MCH5716678.1 GNAT family N-acetyltransferase [Niabella hibiscisoli]
MMKYTPEKIFTKNLILEPIKVSHAALLFTQLQSDKLYTYIPVNPPESIDKLENKYERWSKGGSDDGREIWLNYAVYHRSIDSYVGTLQATIQKQGNTYIAYEVFPHFWRQGIAKEACQSLIDYLFKEFKLKRVMAHVDTRNIASQKLLQSLGFSLEQTLINADEFKGSKSDEFVYALASHK